MTAWRDKSFNELSTGELFDILKLRQDVFIIEQQCIYPDIDDSDKLARHLFAYDPSGRRMIAYARLLPANTNYVQAAIGRVIIDESERGTGLGRQLMEQAILAIRAESPTIDIKISAQEHLEKFYMGLGFNTVSEPYDDDGIMHIDMILLAGE